MNSKKTRRTMFGVGPKWTLVSLVLSSPVIIYAYVTHPRYVVNTDWGLLLRITGVALIVSGFIFYVISVRTMVRAFKKKRLVTTGVFGVCRNPIYSSWVIAIIPGIALAIGMPVLLLVPVIMYVVCRFMVRSEEEVLLEIFGDDYRKYRSEVNALLPTFFSRARSSGSRVL